MKLPPNRVLFAARVAALTSEGVGRNKNYRVGAVLFKKKRILNAKSNSYKTHPFLSDYSNYPLLHAETACILSHGIDNCRGLDMLVTRVAGVHSHCTMAKPCETCQEVIAEAGLRNVFYTNWEGKIQCL